MLKAEHKEVAKLFAELEKKATTPTRKRTIVRTVLSKLTTHACLENEVMYPEVRRLVPDLEDNILESYEEHHVVDVLANEVAGMEETHERYFPKFTVLMENVRHHVKEEGEEWFPTVRSHFSRTQLREIGLQMAELKLGRAHRA
jgi:hemerythrin superfamily protein